MYELFSFNADPISEDKKLALLLDTAFNNKVDSFGNAWYSKHLSALKEPVIFSDNTSKEVIRFTWLRTFHNPIAVRIEKNDSVASLYLKQCNGTGGYDPGNLTVDEEKNIDASHWDELMKSLRASDFWEMPTYYPFLGFDGAQWILEAKIDGEYHVVDRWDGGSSRIGDFCLKLLGMTDLNVKKKDVY